MYKVHWVAFKVNESRMGSCKLCWRPIVVYTSINIRKIKFIAYTYIRFYPEVDEKSVIKAKTEAGKHLHAVFLLTAEQRH